MDGFKTGSSCLSDDLTLNSFVTLMLLGQTAGAQLPSRGAPAARSQRMCPPLAGLVVEVGRFPAIPDTFQRKWTLVSPVGAGRVSLPQCLSPLGCLWSACLQKTLLQVTSCTPSHQCLPMYLHPLVLPSTTHSIFAESVNRLTSFLSPSI